MLMQVVTLFPDFVQTVTDYGVTGRALRRGSMAMRCINPRDFTRDAHRTVDDRPYGGGPGMVMKFEPLIAAIDAARDDAEAGTPVVYLSPQGRKFDQATARRFAELPGLILLCGRYEGVDERVLETAVDEEVSLGDFVLSGGEIAAMAIVDAVVRLLPGVLGDDESAEQDSFTQGLLDHPHYTRPDVVAGLSVPAVLMSGDHAAIARWRTKQALGRSNARRPDLIEQLNLSGEQRRLLDEYIEECAGNARQVEDDE